jgi:hypothetical protein
VGVSESIILARAVHIGATVFAAATVAFIVLVVEPAFGHGARPPSNPLKPLALGAYKVIWRVLSVDTHWSRDEFTFTVGK